MNKIALLICILLCGNSFSQETKINFTRISVEEGLSQSSAFAIVQDNFGFIWIGTYDGLNRYNGYEIEIFKHNDDSLSLPDNYIQALCIDNKNNLWVGTNNRGICIYNYAKNHFEPLSRYFNKSINSNDIGNCIYSLKTLYDTAIVAHTERGIHVISLISKNIYNFDKVEFEELPNTHSLLSYFTPNKLNGESINCELIDSQGNLWLGTSNGLKRRVKNKWVRYCYNTHDINSLSSNEITSIFEDKGGVIWIGTSLGGICKWDRISSGISLLRKKPFDPQSLSNNKVRCFYQDNENNIWIGTVENGINLWNRELNSFKHWNMNNCPSLNSNHIRDIDKWNDNYIIATDGGGIQYFFPKKDKNSFKDLSLHDTLQKARVWDLFVDDTSLWIASYSHGLINKTKNNTSNILPDVNATWISSDNNKNIWIGTFGQGIFKINANDVKNWTKDNSAISDNRIYSIVPDSNNNIWIATKKGLNRYDIQNDSFTVYTEDSGLPNNTIMAIICNSDSTLWLTTNKGVSNLNPYTNKTTNYTINDGLQNNEFLVHSFLQTKSGEILLGGIQGFNIFPPKMPAPNMYIPEVVITDFFVDEGISPLDSNVFTKNTINLKYFQNEFSIEFAALSFAEPSKNNYMYKLEGFDKHWKESGTRRYAHYTNVPPGNYIFKVKASNNNNIWNNKPKDLNINISPAFWQTIAFKIIIVLLIIIIIIVFTHLRFYKIKQANIVLEEKVKERTQKIETTLKKLKITQNNLIQSEKMASIGILTAGVAHEINNPVNYIYVGVNSLIRDFEDIIPVVNELNKNTPCNHEKINQLKEELEFDLAVKAIQNTLPDIKMGAERIKEIVSSLGNFSRIEAVNFQKVDIRKELESVLILLKNKYKHNITIKKEYCNDNFLIECYPGKINQALMNIVSNAIDAIGDKKGTISISTSSIGNNLFVKIKDTGVGMDNDTLVKIYDPFFTTKPVGKGMGLGLSITYTIIDEHNGKILVNSEKGKGTEFIIELPIKQTTYKNKTHE